MALNDTDYAEILSFLRRLLQQNGLGSMDDRLTRSIRGSEGAYYDLVFFLKRLIEEINLGTDRQLGSVLSRFRDVVETESDQSIQGIRVSLTEEEQRVFQTETIDFAPDPQSQEVVTDLLRLLDELHTDRTQPPGNEERA